MSRSNAILIVYSLLDGAEPAHAVLRVHACAKLQSPFREYIYI
jgi:hypothetical protein